MSRSDTEWAEWAREHRAAFEVAPLMEVRGGERLQVGFTLSLYAAAPMEKAPGHDRQEAAQQLWEELRTLAQSAVPEDERVGARAELEPPHAALLRPENEFKPEVGLTWRIFHADEYLQAVTAGDRERLAHLEKRLLAMGLKQKAW